MAGQEGEGRGGGGGGVGGRGEREGTGASTGDTGPSDCTRDTLTTPINHKHTPQASARAVAYIGVSVV
jgi:hypothetical protein